MESNDFQADIENWIEYSLQYLYRDQYSQTFKTKTPPKRG
jgi:hypothetical protein